MFEILKRKVIAKEIINQFNKSERQMNISETGRMLDMLKLAEYEDSGVGAKKVTDPMEQHEWVNIAVDFRARNLARCDFKLYSGKDTEVKKGPEYDLFLNVNAYMSKYQLWEATEMWRMIRGEAIWVLTGKDFQKLKVNEFPQEIIVADPNQFSIVMNKTKTGIIRWMFKETPDKTEGIPFSIREIIHFRIYNKWNSWRGVNYWRAQEQNIEQDYEASRSNTMLIKNKSIPPGILSADQVITETQADKLVELWEKKHKGSKNVGKIAVVGHAAKYQPIAMSHSDMQYFEMKKWNRITILAKAGIPPVLVSVKDESTPLGGTDTKEQQLIYWNQTQLPENKAIEDKLRTDFFGRFGLTMTGRFDIDNIQELQEDYDKKVEKAVKLFGMGFTRNEINEKLELGFEEVDWGDGGYRSKALKPMRAEEEEPPEIPPPAPFMTLSDQKQDRWLINYILESRKRWDSLEDRYRSKIKQWIYEQRKYYLNKYGKEVKQKTYEEFLFWAEQEELLKKVSEVYFYYAIEEVGLDLITIFRQTGFTTEFDIFSIDVDRIVNVRLDMMKDLVQTTKQAIDTVIRDGIKEGFTTEQMGNVLREKFTQLGNHADTIARTEMGIIKSDAEATAYAREGVSTIQWIHIGGRMTDRPDHVALDGQERLYLQEVFETDWGSLMYPRDPNGAPGDIINCYCDFIPVAKEA